MRKRLNVMKILMKKLVISLLALSFNFCFQYKTAFADNGYRLWLRYEVVKDQSRLKDYQFDIQEVVVEGNTPILKAVYS
jgi:alpha-glucuronidase